MVFDLAPNAEIRYSYMAGRPSKSFAWPTVLQHTDFEQQVSGNSNWSSSISEHCSRPLSASSTSFTVASSEYTSGGDVTMAMSMAGGWAGATGGVSLSWRQELGLEPRLQSADGYHTPTPPLHRDCQRVHSELNATVLNIKEEYSDPSDYSSDTCSDFDWNSIKFCSTTSSNVDSRSGHNDVVDLLQRNVSRSRRSPHAKVTPEENERRRIRRERNKLAAARCRQRRVDLTNQLLVETESLEDEKLQLEREITNLQRQRQQLEYVLDSHSARCGHNIPQTSSSAASVTRPSSNAVEIATVSTRLDRPTPGERQTMMPNGYRDGVAAMVVDRPSSLSLPVASIGGGIGSSTTPMSFGSLGLDCMVDGHTGLTPITGAPSCAASVTHRLGDELTSTNGSMCGLLPSPTTLMTL